MTNKDTIQQFITEIWNENKFEKLESYMHPNFIDHSLPPALPANTEGMKLWIIGTGKSFEHKTLIDDVVAEDDKVMIKIKMQMKHIGVWRNIEPTNFDITTIGYRYYKLKDNKIVEHWALIDGNSIENQLKEAAAGCKIQE
jgi:predicted SnoaL-like aldol condensation-catalyzing enzyme